MSRQKNTNRNEQDSPSIVRRARLDDRRAIQKLLDAAGLPSGGITDHLERGFCVAELGDSIVGVAGLESYGEFGLLRSVAVQSDQRQAGLGASLVRHSLTHAQELGMQSVYLLTVDASGFFARLDFEIIPRDVVPRAVRESSEFAAICPTSAAAMRRTVDCDNKSRGVILQRAGAHRFRTMQTLDTAVSRATAAVEAGADCVFVPDTSGALDRATIKRLVEMIPGPLNILAGPGVPMVSELEQMG